MMSLLTALLSIALVVTLEPQAGSHVRGEARFRDLPGHAVGVRIRLDGVFIPETEYPARIRSGRCAGGAGKIEHRLRAVAGGTSTSTLPGTSIAELRLGEHALVVQDASAQKTLWCGEFGAAPAVKPAG